MAVFTLAQFFDKLRIRDYSFDIGENLISSRAGSGAVLVSVLGANLWEGSISLAPNSHDTQREMESLLAMIRIGGNFFEYTPTKAQYPFADPTGSILGSANPTITGVVSGYGVNFAGLPVGYKITAGDYFSYSEAGIHKLHRIAQSATASAGGTCSTAMNNPFRVNALPANNTLITLKRPKVTCRYIPASRKGGTVDLGHTNGQSFDFIQAVQL